MAVDAAMAACYVAVMATALVQEAPHEYLGIALFALVVAHVALNRRWFAALRRGRYDAVRTLQLVAVAGLLACIVAQMASALVLSKHAFAFLPAIPGAAWARRAHMLCSYWGFVFAFAHAGLQLRTALARVGARRMPTKAIWACRIAFGIVACLGAWSFFVLRLPEYLSGRVQFAYADYDTPLALMFAQYASVAVLVAGAFHYAAGLLRRRGAASKNRREERERP
jgi:hypothetical protein